MATLAWIRVNGGPWNGNPLADPASDSHGIDLGATDGQALFPILHGAHSATAGAMTANFGATAFAQAVPDNYTAGWPNVAGSGFTTLAPAKLNGPGSLSNGNLTFTTGGLLSGVQAVDGHAIGRLYFEVHYDHKGAGATTNFGGGVGRVFPPLDYSSFVTGAGAYNGGDINGGLDFYSFTPASPTDNIGSLGALSTFLTTPTPLIWGPGDVLCVAARIGNVPPVNFPLPPEIKEVLLPSAELQFTDANGHPYAGGTLELLVPGTTTFKDTWADPDGTALNTNPIVLDAAGRCIVYGDGAYRSILKDVLGNLIWDRETTTEVSAAMMPVVGAPTIAEAQRLLGIDDSGLPAETAAREAADAAETAARIAADANLQSEIDAETAARIAADAALAAIGGPNVRAGTVTTNSSGFAHITFATPFPTACQGITVTPSGQHAPTPLTATTNTPDAAGCDVYTGVYSGTTGVAAAATSVYYIAVGN